MHCRETSHCQTLTTLKSEGAACLNNQKTFSKKQPTSDITISNKELERIFRDGSFQIKPDRSDSPLQLPNEMSGSPMGQQGVIVASPVQAAVPDHPTPENLAPSPIRANVPNSPYQDVIRNSPSPVVLQN